LPEQQPTLIYYIGIIHWQQMEKYCKVFTLLMSATVENMSETYSMLRLLYACLYYLVTMFPVSTPYNNAGRQYMSIKCKVDISLAYFPSTDNTLLN